MVQDQRNSERHKVRFHLVYDDGSSFNAGVVSDVSEGGLFLETSLPLPIGTVVTLTPVDTKSPHGLFEVQAQVIRSVPPEQVEAGSEQRAGMGLQFVNLTPEERASVVKLIWELEDRAFRDKGAKDPFLGVVVPGGTPR